MPTTDEPPADVEVDEALVRCLVRGQRPDLADRRLTLVGNGWDNVIYRLGDDLCVRVPRRQIAAPIIEHEHRWLPAVAQGLPLPVPVPVHAGGPACGYPWAWSICPWFEGNTAIEEPPSEPTVAAQALGSFLSALHQPAPPDAPPNPFRGVPLTGRDESVRFYLLRLHDVVDVARIEVAWGRFLDPPAYDGPAVWLHGDLHPGNVIVRNGRVAAVIDFGDITAGDPACDLSVGYMMFDGAAREAFFGAAGPVDPATRTRARAWSLALGLAYLNGSAGSAAFAELGRRAIAAALDAEE